jgi:CBS domain containing-hemolysin-like protein
VRDTLQAEDEQRAEAFARAVLRVAATTPVYELLRNMREQRVQLAVVDQGRELLGVVTLTDVVRRVLPRPPSS